MKSPILNLSPKKIALVLGVIALLLAIIYGVLFYINSVVDISRVSRSFIELFNLDAEVSIPTWFSQTLLLIIALLLGWIAVWRHREKAKKLEIVEWSALSTIALFMSIDDGAAVHEKFSMFMEQYIGDMTGTFFYFSWVILGMVIIVLMVLVFFRLWWSLPASRSSNVNRRYGRHLSVDSPRRRVTRDVWFGCGYIRSDGFHEEPEDVSRNACTIEY